jgi:hypothetical protein
LADPAAGAWDPVLDDLEDRVAAAEQGDLGRLDGWTPPPAPGPMTPYDTGRATRILNRQRDLLARLRADQSRAAAAMSAMRRPAYKPFAAPPVYVDRAL